MTTTSAREGMGGEMGIDDGWSKGGEARFRAQFKKQSIKSIQDATNAIDRRDAEILRLRDAMADGARTYTDHHCHWKAENDRLRGLLGEWCDWHAGGQQDYLPPADKTRRALADGDKGVDWDRIPLLLDLRKPTPEIMGVTISDRGAYMLHIERRVPSVNHAVAVLIDDVVKYTEPVHNLGTLTAQFSLVLEFLAGQRLSLATRDESDPSKPPWEPIPLMGAVVSRMGDS